MKCVRLFLLLLALLMTATALQGCLAFPNYYRTTDVADYGVIDGCQDNKSVKALITSFFPEKIEDFFENVRYVYLGMGGNRYAFEAYLEFQILDDGMFQDYVAGIAPSEKFTPFYFDPKFSEYVISDSLELGDVLGDNSYGEDADLYNPEETRFHPQYTIETADIRKILVLNKENRIIYVAMGASDNSGSNTIEMSTFFKRFGIAPEDYGAYCKSLYPYSP